MAHPVNLLPLVLASTIVGIGLGLLWCRHGLQKKSGAITYLTGYLNTMYQMLAKTQARMPTREGQEQ